MVVSDSVRLCSRCCHRPGGVDSEAVGLEVVVLVANFASRAVRIFIEHARSRKNHAGGAHFFWTTKTSAHEEVAHAPAQRGSRLQGADLLCTKVQYVSYYHFT